MAKFRLPSGVGTKAITLKVFGDVVSLRFNKKGEATCADKYIDAVTRICPNLELLKEVETE